MAGGYCHLTRGERQRILELRKEKKSIGFIAQALCRAKSTISMELKRNGLPGNRYKPRVADARARRRRSIPRRKAKMTDQDIARHVKSGLTNEWSPEQIAGRMRFERERCGGNTGISHQSIYKWLWKNKAAGGKWYTHLRHDNRKRKRPSKKYTRNAPMTERTMIDDRPPSVGARVYYGDWEGDTVQGTLRGTRLVTLVDRKSRYTLIARASGKKAEQVNKAVFALYSKTGSLPTRTLTLDNGVEFSGHKELSAQLRIKVYFAHPYCSWERGLNENTNGLIRQYFPKGIDFATIEDCCIRPLLKPDKS
jgi:IS30 family transposase